MRLWHDAARWYLQPGARPSSTTDTWSELLPSDGAIMHDSGHLSLTVRFRTEIAAQLNVVVPAAFTTRNLAEADKPAGSPSRSPARPDGTEETEKIAACVRSLTPGAPHQHQFKG